jgi:hypothetical protein
MTSPGAEIPLTLAAVKSVCTTTPAITGIVGDRSYLDLAPPDAQYPFIVYQLQSATDLYGVGAQRIWSDNEVLIRGVARVDTYEPLAPLAQQIDAAFDAMTVSTTGGQVLIARRIRQYASVEEYEDGPIRHLGGLYRIFAQGI